MSPERRVIVIAGPNGAGKSTFAREFLPNEGDCPVFVNADLIAAGLSPFAPEKAEKPDPPRSDAVAPVKRIVPRPRGTIALARLILVLTAKDCAAPRKASLVTPNWVYHWAMSSSVRNGMWSLWIAAKNLSCCAPSLTPPCTSCPRAALRFWPPLAGASP